MRTMVRSILVEIAQILLELWHSYLGGISVGSLATSLNGTYGSSCSGTGYGALPILDIFVLEACDTW